MNVLIEVSKPFRKRMRFKKKRISLIEANEVLSEMDRVAEDEQLNEIVTVSILEGKELIFKDEYELGKKLTRNILLMVKRTLSTTFKDTAESDKNKLITDIQEELNRLVSESIESVTVVNETRTVVETIDVESSDKEGGSEGISKPKTPFNIELFKNKSFQKNNRPYLIGLLVIFVLSGVGYQYASSTQAETKKTPTNASKVVSSKNKLEEPITNEKEVKESMSSSETISKVENFVQNKDYEGLKKFNEDNPSPLGLFEYSFYQRDWESVVRIPLESLSDEQKGMIATAYIELGNLEEAEILNKSINNKDVTNSINERYMDQALNFIRKKDFVKAEEIQKKLNSEQLKQYINDGKAYADMAKWYQEQSDDREKQWNRILENIGK